MEKIITETEIAIEDISKESKHDIQEIEKILEKALKQTFGKKAQYVLVALPDGADLFAKMSDAEDMDDGEGRLLITSNIKNCEDTPLLLVLHSIAMIVRGILEEESLNESLINEPVVGNA